MQVASGVKRRNTGAAARWSAVLLALALAGCGGKGQEFQMPPAEVSVARVVARQVESSDEFSGRLVASETVEIRPRVAGYLRDIAFEEGGEVRRGQPLFVIDTRPYQAALSGARAELARARAAAEQARSERVRAERLIAARAISREEYEQRSSGARSADAAVQAAQAALDAAQIDLEFAQVESPISGRIGASQLRVGNLVEPGTLLTTVVAQDPMFVYFAADERTYLKYRAGAGSGQGGTVRVAIGDDDAVLREGRLDFVDNAVDPATGTIRARAVLDNPDGALIPGLFARVHLIGSRRDALLIHDQAVLTDQDRKYVFVVGPKSEAVRKDVKLGGSSGGLRVVLEGLSADDRVVVNGVRKIFFPGMGLKPTEVPMTEPGRMPGAPGPGAKPADGKAPAAGEAKPAADTQAG